jgi:hypothetical protein
MRYQPKHQQRPRNQKSFPLPLMTLPPVLLYLHHTLLHLLVS